MGEPSLSPGTVIGRRYTVQGLLGQGGMGEVFAATGPKGEQVALKVLHERAMQDADIVARFQRESEIASHIRSPYVARILGAGKERDGRLWIAFERLEGEGLDVRLRREHYLPFAEVVQIVEDTFLGLNAAHKAGVIHRDIKPANLFVEQRHLTQEQLAKGESAERTRILDFGVSKVKNQVRKKNEPSLTAFDATLGSFAYMAPEQVRGSARVDERADLYALGAVCFRALAGRLPFEGTNAVTLIALKLDRDPPTLESVTGEEWPNAVETFLARIMARDREHRYASAKEGLKAWRELSSIMAKTRQARSRPPSMLIPEDNEPGDRTEVTATTFVVDGD
ncbi:MAG: serine/threonine-protein kinase [Polyangiaceae bacterium]